MARQAIIVSQLPVLLKNPLRPLRVLVDCLTTSVKHYPEKNQNNEEASYFRV